MKLIAIQERFSKKFYNFSIDLDKCTKVGSYVKPYCKGIGRIGSLGCGCEQHNETIDVYKTYGRLIDTECEYIACHKSDDYGSYVENANGEDLVNAGIEYLGNLKTMKI